MTRCERCGQERACSVFTTIALCRECLALVVKEWYARFEEFGKLAQS